MDTLKEHPTKSGNPASSGREFARIPKATETFGISRTRLYGLAAAGRIKMVKMGGTTLIDCASVREFMATLPPAYIRSAA